MLPLPIWDGSEVTPYYVMHAAAILGAATLAAWLNRRQGIPLHVTVLIAVVGAIAGRAGARFLDILEYRRAFSVVGLFGYGTSSIYGGLVVAIAVAAVGTRAFGVSLRRFLDGSAPALALAEAVTRVGCFLAGCCYGVPWKGPLAVSFPAGSLAFSDQIERGILTAGASQSVAVVPVQLLSAAFAAVACTGLVWLFRQRHRDGVVFYVYLVFYGVLRLGMVPLRQEALASMKVFSAGFIAVGALGLALEKRRDLLTRRSPCVRRF